MPPGFDDSKSGKTYDPSSISVVIGINNTVRWTNKASSSDTLTSDGFKESNSFGEIFGGSTISPGDTYEFTFTKSGTFGYHGVPHSWNKGKVTVLQPSESVSIGNQGHIINTVQSECSNEFKSKEFQTGIFPNGTSYTVTYVPVFLLKLNSTGKICINNWSYDKSYDWDGKTFEEPWQYCQGAYSCIQVTPSPQNITVNSVTNITIAYTISSSGSQKGLFEVSPLFYDCTGLPIAVGYDSSHSFDNDFPWLWVTVPCYFSGIHTQIIGTSGIDVSYIVKEYR